MSWFLVALKKYAVFSGRARRKEYWYFYLFYIVFGLVVAIIDATIGTATEDGGGILLVLYSLALFIPSIAVTVRRLHDTDRSGWWVLIALIPLIGPIVLLVFMVFDSQPGENRFGLNPKES